MSGGNDSENGYTPEPSDPKRQRHRVAPGAVGEDPADNPSYDSNPSQQALDSEILKRRKIGRWMSVLAVGSMAVFTLAFFTYAIIYAHRFIKLYIAHVHQWVPAERVGESAAVLPLIVPMIPATFFSLLGLATMVTCMRFISAYVNHTAEPHDGGSVIEQLSREIGGVIRTARGGE